MRMVRKRNLLFLAAIASIALFTTSNALAQRFPRIDPTLHWEITDHAYNTTTDTIEIGEVYKPIEVSQGTFENRMCFRSIRVCGIIVDGLEYTFDGSAYQNFYETSTGRAVKGMYYLDGHPEYIYIMFNFYKDGRFTFAAYMPSSQTYNVEVPVRIDYEFNDGQNNVFEVAWNNSCKDSNDQSHRSPPDNDPNLYYNAPVSGWTVDYWSAVQNEVRVHFPLMQRDSNETSVDFTALCRIKDASITGQHFGAVFWAFGSEYEIVFNRFNNDNLITPVVNASATIQTCAAPAAQHSYYPNYVTSGQNQIAYVVLKGEANNIKALEVMGKLFQQGGGRALKVTIHTFPNLIPIGWTTSWQFDPDYVIATEHDGDRTFRRALAELVGDPDLLTIVVVNETEYPPGYPTGADNDQLLYHNRDLSRANRENIDEWKVDAYIVNFADPQIAFMFDAYNGGDNQIEREGAIAYWESFTQHATANGLDAHWQIGAVQEALLHELGHSFNLGHEPDGLAIRPIMSKGLMGADSTIRYSQWCLDWFQDMPESWVKPGRYGVNMGGAL